MLRNTPKIEDQYTDRSGRTIMKIASRLADPELKELAVQTFFELPDRMQKIASVAHFETATAADVFLSNLYFQGQKHLMKQAEINAIEPHLETMRVLHDLPEIEFADLDKTAEYEPGTGVDLLPGVTVCDYEDLMKLGADFEANYRRLNYDDRIEFSSNFVKYASNLNDLPESVCLYAGVNTALREDAAEQLSFRKAAAERAGKDGSGYDVLANIINIIKEASQGYILSADLIKIAHTVHNLDSYLGLTGTEYDKRMPDAWHAMLKKAENAYNASSLNEDPTPLGMTKSDIISRFGEQALDEVENPDGSINPERLKQIMQLFGEDTRSTETEDREENRKANTEGDKRTS